MRRDLENLFVTVDDISVSYTDSGNEKDYPVIFIHGFPLNKSMWENQRNEFWNKYRVITYDLRGYGNSESGFKKISIALFATDLLHFMDALGLNKVILCGFSMGGYIALQAMEKFPERIAGLALANTQCQADTQKAKEKRIKTCDIIRQKGLELFADELLKGFFYTGSEKENSKSILEIRRVIEGTSVEVVCDSLMALANRKETCQGLDRIDVPTLIMAGKEDTVIPLEKSEFMKTKIKGATLHIISDAAHLSNVDNPLEFNRHLSQFLQQVKLQQSHLLITDRDGYK
ncbi:MAG: alpha/beta hydrolase [Cyclobacteriaceae bacterium]|nr:alpha/beta hydrolase [Cyclobacteriaceae bacterium]